MTKTTDEIPVHIVFVLDRSGSMGSIAADVVGGFNTFLAEQQAQPGKCRMTMIQFDSQDAFEILADATKIADVKPLTLETYQPRGGTPLFDAEGKAIHKQRERAAKRKTAGKKNEAVLFVTFTDGEENSSQEYDLPALTALKKQAEEDGWTFLYLGTGHDAYAQARTIGTHVANTSSYAKNSKGIKRMAATTSTVTRGYRQAAFAGKSDVLAQATSDVYGTFGVDKDIDDVDNS